MLRKLRKKGFGGGSNSMRSQTENFYAQASSAPGCFFLIHGVMENRLEATIVYWGYIGAMETKMETTTVYGGYIGIMESRMEAAIVYWGYIGIMAKKMETTTFPEFCKCVCGPTLAQLPGGQR